MTHLAKVQYQWHDFIVIGAGISGLQAGILFAQNNQDFIILEASDKVGGRIGTDRLCDVLQQEFKDPQEYPEWVRNNVRALNTPIEYGATWISEEHTFMLRMLKQFKIRVFPQYYDGATIYGKEPGQYQEVRSLHQHYVKYETEIQHLLNEIEKIKEELNQIRQMGINTRMGKQKLSAFIDKYDSISVEEFILQELNNEEVARQILNEIETLECISGDKWSMMQLLDDDSSLELIRFYIGSSENTIDGMRVESGMLTVPQRMLKKLVDQVQSQFPEKKQQEIVRMNCIVTKIDNQNEQEIKIHVRNSNKVFKCKKVLFSVPIAVINQIEITGMSAAKKLIVENQVCGDVNRVYFVFQHAFWRYKFSGYGSFNHTFPFNEITDLSPANLSCGVLAFIFVGEKYNKWVARNPDPKKRLEFLKGVLADIFLEGDKESPHLKKCFSYRRTFSENPFIRAGYQATTGKQIWKQVYEQGEDYGQTYEREEKNIIYIGSEFAEEFSTYMEGALRLARKRTHQVLNLQDPWTS